MQKNYRQTSQLYQLDVSVRILFLPEFNVWQIHKMDYPTWKQLRFEVVGYNSNIAFDFAMLYVKLLKYGLDEKETLHIKSLGYDVPDDENYLYKKEKI